MVLNHLAAILLFSGPVFYIGLWMAVDPASAAKFPELLFRFSRRLIRNLAGAPDPVSKPKPAEISPKVRTALRFVGLALLLFAITA